MNAQFLWLYIFKYVLWGKRVHFYLHPVTWKWSSGSGSVHFCEHSSLVRAFFPIQYGTLQDNTSFLVWGPKPITSNHGDIVITSHRLNSISRLSIEDFLASLEKEYVVVYGTSKEGRFWTKSKSQSCSYSDTHVPNS